MKSPRFFCVRGIGKDFSRWRFEGGVSLQCRILSCVDGDGLLRLFFLYGKPEGALIGLGALVRKILVFNRHFYPSYKSGGPVRTLTAMIERLQGFFAFSTITGDTEYGEDNSYAGIDLNSWNQTPYGDVLYLDEAHQRCSYFRKILTEQKPDAVYLNSFFDPNFTIKPLLVLAFFPPKGGKPKVILAPRGEFSAGALALKSKKKYFFIYASKIIGLHRNVVWHASTPLEASDIRKYYPNAEIRIAGNLSLLDTGSCDLKARHPKEEHSLRVIFLSRIDPKKNLDGALKMLQKIQYAEGSLCFDIYGPATNGAYWDTCRKLMHNMPPNIHVRCRGEVPHERVQETFAKYDLFLFPTHGENFGHVILEALSAGTPVLTTDQTPWGDLPEKKAGWIISPQDIAGGAGILRNILEMSPEDHVVFSKGARDLAEARLSAKDVLEANKRLFDW